MGAPACVECTGIRQRFTCATCGQERPRFRTSTCIECALRIDISALFDLEARPNAPLRTLREILVTADRPESIYTWMRNPKVRTTLAQLGADERSLTHDSLDQLPTSRHIDHLRAILVDAHLLPQRDEALHRFERWLAEKLEPLPVDLRKPVERFATWHHLRSIRRKSSPTTNSQSSVHNAKQEITAAIAFLTWLHDEHGRTLNQCRQAHVDLWLAAGPTTRFTVRNFLVVAMKERLVPPLIVPHRKSKSTRKMTHEDRIEWIRRCLVEEPDTVAFRTAAMLLVLYAQPLSRVASLQIDAITEVEGDLHLTFNEIPVLILEPFAELVRTHLAHRAPSRTRDVETSPWLFPGGRAGTHINCSYLMTKIRDLGINLLAAKNRALDDLVTEMPPPLVADLLGYSYQVTTQHAASAGNTFAHYPTLRR